MFIQAIKIWSQNVSEKCIDFALKIGYISLNLTFWLSVSSMGFFSWITMLRFDEIIHWFDPETLSLCWAILSWLEERYEIPKQMNYHL